MSSELSVIQLAELKNQLFASDHTCYAIVDSAMSNEVHVMVQIEALKYQCLYEGNEAELLEEVAPYLVKLGSNDYLTDWLLENVYKNNAMSFIKSNLEIDQLASHLRQYAKILTTLRNDNGELTKQWAFFAFYDPRVFPRFMAGNTTEQSAEFFAGINHYLCENTDDKELIESYQFVMKDQQVDKETITLNKAFNELGQETLQEEKQQEEQSNG